MAFLIPENLASRSDVPERLQVVARALRDLIGDEVTVWLEETDGEPYLLILDPRSGVVLLYVSTPAERGIAGIPADRPAPNRREVLKKLEDRAAGLADRFDAESRISELPVAAVFALPTVARAQLTKRGIDISAMPVLTAEDFEPEKIRPAFRRILNGHMQEPLSDLQEGIVRGVINPRIVISGASENGNRQLVFRPPEVAPEDVIRVLDRQQERLAEHLGTGYRVIRGVAGSGKTLVLTHRARYLTEYFPNLRVLLVCYNVALSKALQSYVGGAANIDVRTIDSLSYSVLKPKGKWGSPEETEDYAENREVAASLAAGISDSAKYDLVLVDEAQDLDAAGLELAYRMLKSGKDDFIVALDGAQNIYRRRVWWNPPGTTARGRTSVLRMNYRNTREILEFALRFLVADHWDELSSTDDQLLDDPSLLIPPEAASRSGPDPSVFNCASWAEEVETTVKAIKQAAAQGVDWDNMSVLYGSPKIQKSLFFAFREHGLPYYWVTMNGKTKRQVMSVEDVVRSSTVQGMKGLEFSRVFICGANQVWAPDSDDESVRRLLYVGMTRAMDRLTVTFSGDGPVSKVLASM